MLTHFPPLHAALNRRSYAAKSNAVADTVVANGLRKGLFCFPDLVDQKNVCLSRRKMSSCLFSTSYAIVSSHDLVEVLTSIGQLGT